MITLRYKRFMGLLILISLAIIVGLRADPSIAMNLRLREATVTPFYTPRPIGFLQPVVTVTTVEDIDHGGCSPTDCSLRMAINSVREGGTINIAVRGTLQVVLPNAFFIDKSMTINGPGPKSTDFVIKQYEQVESVGAPTLFHIAGYLRKITFQLTMLTIEGGEKTKGSAINNQQASLLINNVTFRRISNAGEVIANLSGTAKITNSIFSDNSSSMIDPSRSLSTVVNNTGTLDVLNTTFYDNHVSLAVIGNAGKGTIVNTTILNDEAKSMPLIWNVAQLDVHNSLLVAIDSLQGLCHETFTGSNNLQWFSTNVAKSECPSHIKLVNPILGKISDNGGGTDTIPLLAGSPAIGAGDLDFCPTSDQRGAALTPDTPCDIGAFQTSGQLSDQMP